MTDKKRIILWGGWYGSRNIGDRALLLAITDMLHQALGDVHFIVLSAKPSEVYRYTKEDSDLNIEVIRTKDLLKVIIQIVKADLFIFGGAVPFFDKFGQLSAMLGLTFFARLFKTPYFLWSVSSQPISSWLAQKVFRFVLSGAEGITYRDEHTRTLFRKCGVSDENMDKVVDAVFSLRSGEKKDALVLLEKAGCKTESSRSLVALTPRSLRQKDGEAETHYSPQSDSQYQHQIDSFANVLDWLWENNYQPIFIPMNTVSPDDDRSASKLIMKQAKHGGNALIVDQEISPRLAVPMYGICEMSFVSRVHGSITSFIGGCPPMMYAFDKKHKGIMDTMELGEFILHPERDAPEKAVFLVKQMLNKDVAWKAELKEKYQTLNQDSFIPKKMIFKLIG